MAEHGEKSRLNGVVVATIAIVAAGLLAAFVICPIDLMAMLSPLLRWFEQPFFRLCAALAALVFLAVFIWEASAVFAGRDRLQRRINLLKSDVLVSYQTGLNDLLDRFARWVGDKHDDGKRNIFSATSYLFCLGAAVFYPLFFLGLFWAFGDAPGSLLNLPIFPDGLGGPARILYFLLLFFGTAFAYVICRTFLKWPETVSFIFAILPTIAIYVASQVIGSGLVAGAVAGFCAFAVLSGFVGAGTGARAGAVVGAGAVVLTLTVLIAGTSPVASSVVAVIAGAVTVAFGFAAADVVQRADNERRRRFWMVALISGLALAPALLLVRLDGSQWWIVLNEIGEFPAFQPAPSWLPDWLAMDAQEHARAEARWERPGRSPPSGMTLLLFFAFLPAINAPFDWLSLAVSRWLLALVATPPNPLKRIGEFFAPIMDALEWPLHFLVIFIDAVIALFLACGVVFATVLGFSFLNELHKLGGGSGLGLDETEFISVWVAEISANPGDPQYWWIYAMMFWTLVPTLGHLFAFAGNLAAKAGREATRKKWADSLARDEGKFFPALGHGFRLALARVFPGILLCILLYTFKDRIIDVMGAPIEWLGACLGLDWPCTDDFTLGSLRECLGEGSTYLATKVEELFGAGASGD